MIIPCIDLMDGKVVQLVRGREKVLEGKPPNEMLAAFAGFPQIQVIDLDAATGRGENADAVEQLAQKATIRAGGGIRTVERARQLLRLGAYRVIVGTAAFTECEPDHEFLHLLTNSIDPERVTLALDTHAGHIVTKGWQSTTNIRAEDVLPELEPYCSGFLCTYVDKEGMMQGTDLDWFARLRSRTRHELIAAGGITTYDDVRSLQSLGIHCAIGMSIYTGRLSLPELAAMSQ